MPDGFWDQLIWSSRNVATDMAAEGLPVAAEFDVFAAGTQSQRDVAFAEGYASGQIDECRLALDDELTRLQGRSRSSGSSDPRRGVPSAWTGTGMVRQVPAGTATQALPW